MRELRDDPYGYISSDGSGALYRQKGSDTDFADYARQLYERGNNWFIRRPYKGFGAWGALFGAGVGLMGGPLGMLLGALVGASSMAGVTTSYKLGTKGARWSLNKLQGIKIEL
jgi:hypothetical protein